MCYTIEVGRKQYFAALRIKKLLEDSGEEVELVHDPAWDWDYMIIHEH